MEEKKGARTGLGCLGAGAREFQSTDMTMPRTPVHFCCGEHKEPPQSLVERTR